MSTGIWVLIVIIAAVLGFVGGFFAARKYMEDYLKKNPPINEQMMRTMMIQIGQKPSEKKFHQMIKSVLLRDMTLLFHLPKLQSLLIRENTFRKI